MALLAAALVVVKVLLPVERAPFWGRPSAGPSLRRECSDTCPHARDGKCQEGRPGGPREATRPEASGPAEGDQGPWAVLCDLGTDSTDCGCWDSFGTAEAMAWTPVKDIMDHNVSRRQGGARAGAGGAPKHAPAPEILVGIIMCMHQPHLPPGSICLSATRLPPHPTPPRLCYRASPLPMQLTMRTRLTRFPRPFWAAYTDPTRDTDVSRQLEGPLGMHEVGYAHLW